MKTSGGFDSVPDAAPNVARDNVYGMLGPAARELAAVLTRRCRDGVNIDLAGWNDKGSRLDIIASGRRERIGIVCDTLDVERLRRNAALLETAFVHRVMGCSALDAIVDPEAVADAIARAAPSLFRVSSHKSRRRSGERRLVAMLPQRARLAGGFGPSISVDNAELSVNKGHAARAA